MFHVEHTKSVQGKMFYVEHLKKFSIYLLRNLTCKKIYDTMKL